VSRPDRVLFFVPLGLTAAGLVLVYSASSILGLTQHDDDLHYVSQQALRALVGVAAFLWLSRLDYHRVGRMSAPLFAVTLGLLALIAGFGVGEEVRGARRWISVLGMSFQPGELARLSTLCFLAVFLAGRGQRVQSLWQGYLPALALLGASSALVALQPNLSSAAVLFVTGWTLLAFAGARLCHLLGTVGLGAAGFLAMITQFDYQRERLAQYVQYLLTGKLDVLGSGWQLDQSLIALGSGGLFGRGFGRGLQKFLFLPDPHTDFILSIAGEEGGLLATSAILGAFVALIWRGYRTALRAPDALGALLAAGITTQLALYAFVNMGVATGLLPTTGLPLPFVSFGGSALVVNLAAVGMLANISRQAGERRTGRVRAPAAPLSRARRAPAWEGLR
jgi:cell division protein FtsW